MVAQMTFADDVREETRTSGIECRLCVLLKNMDTKTRGEVNEVLADQSWNAEAISRAMKRRGWEIRGDSIRKHRRNCLVR
jgi:hypothetical protein